MRRLLLYVLLPLLASGLGCGERAMAPSGGTDAPEFLPPDPDGMLLPGEAADRAVEAVVSLQATPVSPADIEGGRLKTRIRAVIHPDATVAEVNAALEAEDAAIVSMGAGNPTVILVVSSQDTEENAQAKAAALAQSDAFLFATPGIRFGAESGVAVPGLLHDPDGGIGGNPSLNVPVGWSPTAETPYPHLDLMTLVQTWKTRPMLSDEIRVVLADLFSNPPSHPDVPGLDWDVEGASGFSDETSPDATFYIGNRGFHHAGVIGAGWEGSPLVGVYPDAEILGIAIGNLDMSEAIREIGTQLYRESGKQVLVTPVGFSYDPTSPIPFYSAMLAVEWKWTIRSLRLEDNVFHVSAAGDTGLRAGYEASATTSPWNLAASYTELVDYLDLHNPTPADREEFLLFEETLGLGLDLETGPLRNVLIVGASGEGGDLPTSSLRPHVVAPGEKIAGPCELVDPGSGINPDLCDGTDAAYTGTGPASALVGGLAAYLWNLAPTRTLAEIRSAIELGYERARSYGSIDAYAAVLSLDPNLVDPVVRELMLDVTGDLDAYPNIDEPNGIFDEKDLRVFVSRIEQLSGQTPGAADLRFDLNGDDIVGDTQSHFDLDANVPPRWEQISVTIDGQSMDFDETQVSDLQVLCYYAYSDLYLGSSEARDILLNGCADPSGVFIQIDGVPQRVSAGEQVEVTVTAGYREPGGNVVYEAGVEISFENDGVEAFPREGKTDASGIFRTTITFGDDRNDMVVGAWAESGDGEAYAERVARRRNEIELVERTVYFDASVFATYNREKGVPGDRFIQEYAFVQGEGTELIDSAVSKVGSGSRVGILVSGTADTQVRSEVELGAGTQRTRFSLSSLSSGSITLSDPNFDILSYQTQAEAVVDVGVEFIVWGDGATFNLSGSSSSAGYEVDLEGPEDDILECDNDEDPCGSIAESGTLEPGRHTFDLYHYNGGQIRWFDGCTGCTTSGTESSSGSMEVVLDVTPLP